MHRHRLVEAWRAVRFDRGGGHGRNGSGAGQGYRRRRRAFIRWVMQAHLVQFDIAWEDPEANFAKVADMLDRASDSARLRASA